MSQNLNEQSQAMGEMQNLRRKTHVLFLGLAIAAVIIAGAIAFINYSVKNTQEEAWRNIEKDMQNMAFTRAHEINNWLKTMLEPANRFAEALVVKQFAEEFLRADDNLVIPMESGEGDSPYFEDAPDLLSQQMDLMRSYLRDIVKDNEFSYGGMTNRKGEMYMFTDPARNSLNPANQRIATEVALNGQTRFGPTESDPQYGLVIGIFMPITIQDANDQTVTAAVLYLVKPVGPKLRDLFTFTGYTYTGKGYASALLQKTEGGMQIVYYNQDRVQDIAPLALEADSNIAFGQRASVSGGEAALSRGAKVMLADWWVMLEQNYSDVQAFLSASNKDTYIVTGLIAVVLLLLMAIVWWWLIGHERSAVLRQFQDLFQVIDEQKRLLDSINSTISDPISLTDNKGTYLYVNRAFGLAVGREAKDVPGMDIAAVFGFDTAKRLNTSDQHVLMTGEEITINEMLWLQSRRHHFQISKTPLRDGDNRAPIGIVSVFRDMTRVVETQEHSRRMVQQTIDALVQAIERTDPFLGGHSRIMGAVTRLISKFMNLSEKDTATITAAATLSQIGKMFVPREIVDKPGALTDEEKKVMEQHVEHTRTILSNIEFEDLPVIDAIEQMNERLDGKGYPHGLQGEEIKIYGRVLAVANAFTAMARPRSYRPAMDVDTVLNILEKESGSYDQHIVQVLREVLHTPAGEQVVAMAAQSKVI
ncbi:MAG: PAS domain-containing protein [Deltaproteobacteria bacterium]|jgi:PAS domain S-box-containing protein|nr:PAS domain-containing protein [Deltaproteobacteria bacterium]